jgi:hypothetical protein
MLFVRAYPRETQEMVPIPTKSPRHSEMIFPIVPT